LNLHHRLYIVFLVAIFAVACQTGTQSAVETPTRSAPTAVPATATPDVPLDFSGDSAFNYLVAQMDIGPRWPGSPGHIEVRQYITDTLTSLGWSVEPQRFDYQGFAAMNIIAKANEGQGDIIIVAAHYDTRRLADQTPSAAADELPVPGAVDGASGVAVLLELARTLTLSEIPREVWLVFFDVEDNGSGGLPEWNYIAGSTYMAANLTVQPEAVVVVDMVGDADQQLFYEGNSHPGLRQTLWTIAGDLGYGEAFIPQVNHTMIDDHLPFVEQGLVAVDIIDFDYPYWHTVEDTADKASPESLVRVGRTLEVWLENHVGEE
jgi:acetylornithine deacetylase/succinyl-diaminopimelate desuccinylase-like protein